MNKSLKRALAALSVSVSLWLGAPSAYAMPDIMPLNEVEEGMEGTLYTVVNSSGELHSFPCRILGVMASGRGSMPYIIARSEGPFADTDGGLMQGMSGSPVYVDGLLLGAASATLSNMDPHTFFITPIEEMLPIWDMPDKKNKTRVKSIDIKKAAEERAKIEKELAEKDKKKQHKDETADEKAAEVTAEKTADATPENAGAVEEKDGSGAERQYAEKDKNAEAEKKPELPSAGREPEYKGTFMVSGFGNESLAMLQKKLAPLGYKAESFGGFSSGNATTLYGAELEPGQSVGAAVMYGDFAFAATGTVTAVDGNRVLGFGHPFLHRGNVNYFMTDATILGMVNGVSDGMKFANTDHIIGRISQDRGAGISGTIGVFPSVVPIRIHVKDDSLGRDVNFSATMAYDEDFLPLLSQTVSYAALGRVADTGAESTVKVHYTVRTNAVESGTFERTNMFYAQADAGQTAFGELAQTMAIICSDKEKEANILDIKVDVSAVSERRTASLISAMPDRPEVRPGDTVNFKVTLKPYRADKVTVNVPYTVPKTQREGVLHLDVHGGGLISVEQLMAAMQGQGVVTPEDNEITTADQLRDLQESPANNEIILEPGPSPVMSEKEQKKAIEEAIRAQEEADKNPGAAKEAAKSRQAKVATDYIIDNVIHAMVTVSKKAPLPEAKPVEIKLDDLLKHKTAKAEKKTDDAAAAETKDEAVSAAEASAETADAPKDAEETATVESETAPKADAGTESVKAEQDKAAGENKPAADTKADAAADMKK